MININVFLYILKRFDFLRNETSTYPWTEGVLVKTCHAKRSLPNPNLLERLEENPLQQLLIYLSNLLGINVENPIMRIFFLGVS
jgi:hypothetical protein